MVFIPAQMRRQMPECLEDAVLGDLVWMFLLSLSMEHYKCFLFSRPLFPLVSSASSPWLTGVLQVAHGADLSCLLNTSVFPSGQRGTSQAYAQTCPSDETLFLPNSCDALLLETMEARRFTFICITSHILCYWLLPTAMYIYHFCLPSE